MTLLLIPWTCLLSDHLLAYNISISLFVLSVCVVRPGIVLTVQALSEDDHKFWIHAMGGKEPVSLSANQRLPYTL